MKRYLIAPFWGFFITLLFTSISSADTVQPDEFGQCPDNSSPEISTQWTCNGKTGTTPQEACDKLAYLTSFGQHYTAVGQADGTQTNQACRIYIDGDLAQAYTCYYHEPSVTCNCDDGYGSSSGSCVAQDQDGNECPAGMTQQDSGYCGISCSQDQFIAEYADGSYGCTDSQESNEPEDCEVTFTDGTASSCSPTDVPDDNSDGIDFGGDSSGSDSSGSDSSDSDTSGSDSSGSDSSGSDSSGSDSSSSDSSNIVTIADSTSSSELNDPCDSRFESCRDDISGDDPRDAVNDPRDSDSTSDTSDYTECIQHGSAACCNDSGYYFRASGESCQGFAGSDGFSNSESLLSSANEHLANIADKICDPREENCEGEHGLTEASIIAANQQIEDVFESTEQENLDLFQQEFDSISNSNPLSSVVTESDLTEPAKDLFDIGSSCAPYDITMGKLSITIDCQRLDAFRNILDFVFLMYTAMYLIDMFFEGFTPRGGTQGRLF